jgi:hypothetical protein
MCGALERLYKYTCYHSVCAHTEITSVTYQHTLFQKSFGSAEKLVLLDTGTIHILYSRERLSNRAGRFLTKI